jgi:hypothetical protein
MFARALVVLLAILNLGVAAWTLFRPDPVASAFARPEVDGVTLQLLSEVKPRPATEAPVERVAGDASRMPAGAGADTLPSRCFSLGPYAGEARAVDAAARLGKTVRRADVRQVARGARAWSVSLPAHADRAAAEAMAARIRAAGFEDLFIVPSGAAANSIALGRYGNEAAARQHAARLQAAGFMAQAQPVGEVDSEYWVDVAAAPEVDMAGLRAAGGATRAEMVDCP